MVVAQGVARLEHRAVAVAERQVNDVELGQERQGREPVAEHVHQHAADALHLLLLDGVQGADGEVVLRGGPLLHKEHRGRHKDRDDGDGSGEVVVGAVLAEVLVVDLHREGPVALADEQRRPEVREGPHEHQKRRGQDGGHGELHDDGEEPLDPRAAHVLRRLKQRVVDGLERAVHVDEDEGEELERLDHQDAAKAVDAAQPDAEHVPEEHGDDAVAAQKHDPAVGPDEGRGHAAQDGDDEQEFPAPELVEGVEVGKGDAQQERHQRDGDGHLKAVDDGGGVIGRGEELAELLHGEASVRREHGLLQDAVHGINEEQDEQGQEAPGDDVPHLKFFCLGHGSGPSLLF